MVQNLTDTFDSGFPAAFFIGPELLERLALVADLLVEGRSVFISVDILALDFASGSHSLSAFGNSWILKQVRKGESYGAQHGFSGAIGKAL